jgi:serine O-acetyltransferase
MFGNLRRDFRNCGTTFRGRAREMLLNPAMWAVVGYRFRRWVYTRRLPKLLRLPLTLVAAPVQVAAEVATGIQLSAAAAIGPGLYMPHTGTTVVGSGSVIGANCTLCHGVTIGHRGGSDPARSGSPVFGDRVYIGPGSAVVGPLTVGDDAVVGIAAVVIRSVPPRGVVAGNPARVLSHAGSFDLVRYPGMDEDPARLASLARREEGVAEEAPRRTAPSANGAVTCAH